MKLNIDCVRAILLKVEETCDITQGYIYDSSDTFDGNFTAEEIAYHARQCELSGLFYKYSPALNGKWSVVDLSPAGHKFLADIRANGVWSRVKEICANLGTKSLSAVTQIASAIVTDLIKSQF